ncbi:MAG: IS1634 family transposase, partial [Thermoplasmata archaeon]
GNAQAKLVGLATAVTEHHLPVFHEVFPGNENDAKLFQEVVEEMLEALLKLGVASEELVFVFDKGVSSEEGWRLLARHRTHFVSSLKRTQAIDLLARPIRAYRRLFVTEQGEPILGFRVSRRTVLGIPGTVVVTYNESAKHRQEQGYERAKARFLAECREIGERLSRPHRGRRTTTQSLTERIEDVLPPKWRGVFKYHIGATLDRGFPKFQVRAWVDPKKEQELRSGFGKMVLFTDREDWDDEKIVRTYFARSAMEEDFHVLKDVLLMPVMPIFHRKDPRIRVHAFLCVLGLLFYRWIQLRLEKELGQGTPIDRLARSLGGIRVAAVTDAKGKGGRWVLEKVRDERKELVEALQLARRIPN